MLIASIMALCVNDYKGSCKFKYIKMHSFMFHPLKPPGGLCPSFMPQSISQASVNIAILGVGITKSGK